MRMREMMSNSEILDFWTEFTDSYNEWKNEVTTVRDNNAEGIVFRKVFYNKKSFSVGLRTWKSTQKTYSRNFQKISFGTKIYDFVIKIS